jgi:hypothetical protein
MHLDISYRKAPPATVFLAACGGGSSVDTDMAEAFMVTVAASGTSTAPNL